jgi:hypothetical protein
MRTDSILNWRMRPVNFNARISFYGDDGSIRYNIFGIRLPAFLIQICGPAKEGG